jgi:serine/threonine protein kinase
MPVIARNSAVAPPPSIFAIGEVLSETYVVRELLGAGGMGEVYEAHDLALNRRVAIKAHRPSLGQMCPVQKEAQALAAVHDPAVVSVFTVGSHRGIDYVVMERIHGESLATHLDRRFQRCEQFSVDETLDLLERLAQALSTVHDAGIAHRDVKPANVMLAPGDRVVLMDFGIFIPECDVGEQKTTPGTAEYMAPEAIRGEVAPGTAYLVDFYAFGIIACEMLIGHVPFEGATTSATLLQHLDADVPDLVARRPDVPRALAGLIESLLAKDPIERPESMHAVAWQLRGIRDRLDRNSHVSARTSTRC